MALGARDPAAGEYLVQSDTQSADRWFAGMMARKPAADPGDHERQRFDFLFVDMLLEHYKGAVVMAAWVFADGRDARLHGSPGGRSSRPHPSRCDRTHRREDAHRLYGDNRNTSRG